jgi:hypothetical protein
MRIFLLVLILILNLQSWTKADDIRDFQIEGMSIGDSLLEKISLKDIKKQQNLYLDRGYVYNSKKFFSLTFRNSDSLNLSQYNQVQFHIKDDDKKFILESVSGLNKMSSENCYKQIDIIEKELDNIFKDSQKSNKKKRKHVYDKSGESSTTDVYYFLNDGSTAAIVCTDWSEKIIKNNPGFFDHLRLTLSSGVFNKWLTNEAYK